jgi:hypothetical protein
MPGGKAFGRTTKTDVSQKVIEKHIEEKKIDPSTV